MVREYFHKRRPIIEWATYNLIRRIKMRGVFANLSQERSNLSWQSSNVPNDKNMFHEGLSFKFKRPMKGVV